MTQYAYPFDSGPGANVLEAQWRAMFRNILGTGVLLTRLGELETTEHTPPNMSVDVADGQAWVEGFFYWNTATESLAVPANATGNDRIDLLVVEFDFVANTGQLRLLPGTPAGIPVPPTPTQDASMWQEPLYEVLVVASAVSILDADLTDVRTMVTPITGGTGGGTDEFTTLYYARRY